MARNSKPAAVPQSRLGRLARIGLAAAELAAGTALEGLRGLARPNRVAKGSTSFSTRNAQRLAARLAHLRGAAMKLGQMISLEGADVLPPEFARALAVLRSAATPMPVTQLRRVLGREYGKGWEARFAHFDFEPVAAASIGQVHRARTRDGRDLALKIQYPGVARSIESDVDNVAALLRLFNLLPLDLDVAAIAAEAKRQLAQEADYLQEARFIEHYAQLVADEPALVVPRVHWDLTTKHVMAMDYVDGVPIEALSELDIPQAQRDAIGALLERLMFRELFEFRLMQTDPNFANYLYQPQSRRVVLLDFGATQAFSPEFVANYARVTRAVVDGDLDALARHATAIGYVAADDPPERIRAAIDVILLVCEPLRHRGPYEFASSGLAARARALAFELAVRRGLLRAPPPETMFLHRKLAGSFLLLARIGARVDARALVLPFLPPATASARKGR
ncbi:MAG TPA: AarF/ABC1/UbiB kinase family protein [Burkholderiaceae bacterium]|nr:AarF/ABC1/UbiB kinase family protein [Burkholderiaceae bacterium]